MPTAPPDPHHQARAERAARLQRRLEPAIIAGALLVIPTLLLDAAVDDGAASTLAGILNWSIWLLFLGEVVLMLVLVPDRWRWIREHPLEIAIVVLTPPVMPPGLQSLRAVRLLQLLRLVKTASVVRRAFSSRGLAWAASISLVTVVGGGTIFAAVEGSGERISSWDGVWWAITTVTTVGYSEYVPSTAVGRSVAVVVMAVGIGFVAMLTAAAAERFVNAGGAPAGPGAGPPPQDDTALLLARLDEISGRLERLEDAVTQRRDDPAGG